MTLAVIKSGQVLGATAVLATNTRERILLYTVPAGKTAVVKEIVTKLTSVVNPGATGGIDIYVLKSGGTDVLTTSGLNFTNIAIATIGDAVPIVTSLTSAVVRTAMTLILEAGDALKLSIGNLSGGNIDTTLMSTSLQISGDVS